MSASYFPRAFQNLRTEGGTSCWHICENTYYWVSDSSDFNAHINPIFFLKKTNSSTKDGPNQHLLVKLIRLQLKEAIPQKTSFLLGITQIPPLPTAPFSLFRDEKMSLFARFKTE